MELGASSSGWCHDTKTKNTELALVIYFGEGTQESVRF